MVDPFHANFDVHQFLGPASACADRRGGRQASMR